VAVKKEKAEKEEEKKKRGDRQSEESEEDVGEFLDGPVVMQPLSEGDMGRHLAGNDDGAQLLFKLLLPHPSAMLQRCTSQS
jgi:hypothetical protein